MENSEAKKYRWDIFVFLMSAVGVGVLIWWYRSSGQGQLAQAAATTATGTAALVTARGITATGEAVAAAQRAAADAKVATAKADARKAASDRLAAVNTSISQYDADIKNATIAQSQAKTTLDNANAHYTDAARYSNSFTWSGFWGWQSASGNNVNTSTVTQAKADTAAASLGVTNAVNAYNTAQARLKDLVYAKGLLLSEQANLNTILA